MWERAKAPGAAFLEWEEGCDKTAHLSEKQMVLDCIPSPAIVRFQNGAAIAWGAEWSGAWGRETALGRTFSSVPEWPIDWVHNCTFQM